MSLSYLGAYFFFFFAAIPGGDMERFRAIPRDKMKPCNLNMPIDKSIDELLLQITNERGGFTKGTGS